MVVQRKDLICEVSGLSYDFDKRLGTLKMAPNQSCDMSGCVKLFEGIDPDVQMIETFAGNESDTIYKLVAGAWQSASTR